jgi:8-oxo-dGTP pyrophosphatase MutT (NUDIX family)
VAAQVEADAGVLQRKMACTHRNRERFDEVNPVHLTAMRSQDDSLLGLRSLDYERPVLAEQPISYEDLMHQAHPTVRFASQNFIFRASAVGTADPELAILHRADGYAFVAGGKRDVNDSSPRCTAMRETIEEAGVAIRSVAMVRCAILTGSHFKSRWILQDFACFLDDEYASQVSVCSPREHKSLEWVRLSRLQELHALDGLASRASVAWAAIAAKGVPEMTHRRRALSRRFVGNLRQLVQGVPSPFVGKVEQVQAGLMQVHEGGKAAVVLQEWWRSRRQRRRAVLLHHDVWSHELRAGNPGTSDPTASRRPSPRARPHVRLPIGSLTARGRSIHRSRLGKSSQMTRRRMRAVREDSAVRIQQEWRVHAGCGRHERELAAEFLEGIAELVDSMFASVIARVVRKRVRSIVARHFYERTLLVVRECLRARAGRRLRLRNAWCSFSAVLLNRAVTLWQDRAVRIDLAWAFECIAFRHFYEKTWPGRRLQLSNAWCSLCARGGSAVLLSRAVTLWQDRAMRIDLAWAFELLARDRLYDKNRRIASVQALWDRHQEAVAVAGSSEVAPASVGDMVPLYKRMSPETALIMRSEREAKEARGAKEVSEGGASRPSGRHPALTQSRLPTNAEIELANKRAPRSGRVFAARPEVAPETGLFFEGVGGSTGVVSIASADPTQAKCRRLLATKIQTAFRGRRVRKSAVFSVSQMATFDPSDKAQHKDVTRSASAVGEKVATILMVHGGEPTAAELEATARARAPGDAGGGMGVLVSVADDEEIGMFGTVLSYPTRRLDWVPATDQQDTFEEDLATGLRLSMQRVQPKQKARGGRKQAFLEAAAEAICKREGRRPPTKQRQPTLRTVHEAVPEPDREEDEVRCRAAKLIQLRLCLHVSRCCRRRTRDAKVAMAWPGKRVTGEPSSTSQMVSIEELVCDACGDTGLIDDEGVCARCKSHHTTRSQLERRKGMGQARALLTFTEGSSCS